MKICLISPNKDTYSETFIKAHIEHLAGEVVPVFGNILNYEFKTGKRVLKCENIFIRQFRKLQRMAGTSNRTISNKRMAKWLNKENFDVVLAEYGMTGAEIMTACSLVNVPLVVHFHGMDAHEKKVLENHKEQYENMFKNAAAIICVSIAMQNQLISLGTPKEKIYLNPCGVNITEFSQCNPAENPPAFLAVGRFTDKKAPYLTILAFKKVLEKVPNARLTMIGDGSLMEVCQRLTKSFDIAGKVDLKGICSSKEIALEMSKSRVFVQHSLIPKYGDKIGDSEGTPVAILEAMASGLPIISTRHAGIKDAIVEGECGLLCDEGDVNRMAENMIKIAETPELASNLGNNARKRAEKLYSLDVSINNLNLIFKNIKTRA